MNRDELFGMWTGDGSADGIPENKITISIERTANDEKVLWTSRLISFPGEKKPVICRVVCSVQLALVSIEEHRKVGFVKVETDVSESVAV